MDELLQREKDNIDPDESNILIRKKKATKKRKKEEKQRKGRKKEIKAINYVPTVTRTPLQKIFYFMRCEPARD